MPLPPHPRAVVTGAGSGLGRAFCLQLAQRGARLLVSDLSLDAARETAEQARQGGAEATALACDVAQAEQVEALAARSEQLYGGTDLVINNAGVGVAGEMGEIPLADWRWIVDVNLWGVIHGCHAFVPRFKHQGSGHVINVASIAGLTSGPQMAPYNATKAAVVALSETLFTDLAPLGIGVTVLCPAFFRTNILSSARSNDLDGAFQTFANQQMDASKLQAADVARLCLRSCERDQLYCVPMSDARWAWRVKRLMPERFYRRLVPRIAAAVRAQFGAQSRSG